MTHSHLIIKVLSLLLLSMAACATAQLEKKYVGKDLDSLPFGYKQFPGLERHLWRFQHLDLEYEYSICVQS